MNEIKLEAGEKTVLKDGDITNPFRGKLTLTNKRLIALRKKGFFGQTYVKEKDFPIETIIEAYIDVSGLVGNCEMKLTLETGEWTCAFGVSDAPAAMFLGAMGASHAYSSLFAKQRAITNRWINAITSELNRLKLESRESLTCSSCGKPLQISDKFCPQCGNKIK
jgi:hypothetical protein